MTEQETRKDAGTRAYRPVKRGGGDARLVAGVCAGLGRATGVDPIVYRVAIVVLTVGGGMGVLVYVAGWLLLPTEDQDTSLIEGWTGRRYDATDVLALLGALVAMGFLLSLLGGPGSGTLVSLVVLALGLLTAQRRGVDLSHLLRTFPDHFRGHPAPPHAPASTPGTAYGAAPGAAPGVSPGGTPAGAYGGAVGGARSGGPGSAQDNAQDSAAGDAAAADGTAGDAADASGGAGGAAGAGAVSAAGGGAGDTASTASVGDGSARARPDGLIDLGAYGRGPGGSPGAGPQGAGPYGPDGVVAGERRERVRGRWLGSVFFLAACGAGLWAMLLYAPVYGWDGVTTIGYGAAAALLVVGAGLITGAWYGRTRGLVGWGVILAVALVVLPMIGSGSASTSVKETVMRWHPTTVAQASQPVRIGLGAGRLDLTDVPFTSGKPVTVSAEMRAGYLRVIVPRDAEVHIDGAVRFGDIRGDDRVYPSRRGHVRATLEPLDAPGKHMPVIELRLRGTVGDMEVRRAA